MPLFLVAYYASLCGAVMYVSGQEKWTQVWTMMWDGTTVGFIAANVYILFVGSVELFFGIPLKLLGAF